MERLTTFTRKTHFLQIEINIFPCIVSMVHMVRRFLVTSRPISVIPYNICCSNSELEITLASLVHESPCALNKVQTSEN